MQVTTVSSEAVPEVPTDVSRGRAALAGALELVGDRWSLLVVEALAGGPRRFADLQDTLPGIATNVLAQRLRRLEGDGIVLAVPYSRRPLRYAYELTSAGRGLGGAARVLAQWSADQASGDPTRPGRLGQGAAPMHRPCGTPMEIRWYCPTCDQPADADRAGAGFFENAGEELLWV